ncbi:MAG: type II secretion system protein GspC [Pseudomonadota bacterium]
MNSASLDSMRNLSGHPALRAVQQHGPRVLTVLLALWLAWLLAGLFWQFFAGREDASIDPPVATRNAGNNPSTTTGDSGLDASRIVSAHLFGVADVADEPEESTATVVESDDVDEYQGTLELRGTLAASVRENALAIIADGKDEKLYTLEGERNTIKPGITLHAVEAAAVIVNNRGKLERLELPGPEETAGLRPAPRRVTQRAPLQPSRDVKTVLTEQVAQFTQIVSPRPYFVGGQQRGYRLYPGRERQKFAALGLRPGDVVTEIDGVALNNPTQGAQIFNSLANAQSVTVTLERNGNQQTLTLDIAQLENAGQVDEE